MIMQNLSNVEAQGLPLPLKRASYCPGQVLGYTPVTHF